MRKNESSTRDIENTSNPELDDGGAVPTEAPKSLSEGKSDQLGVREGRPFNLFPSVFLVTHATQKNRLPPLNYLELVATSRMNKSLMCLQVC